MNFLYLEARKGILRRYTLIALALFLCLNTVKIIADYHTGEIRPVAANTSGMKTGYDKIYEQIKGPITEETVSFITSEYQRLDGLTADGTYSREPPGGDLQRLYLRRLLSAPQLFLSPHGVQCQIFR